MNDESFIELRDVWKSFSGREILRGVDLDIPVGRCFTLVGGSGTGKSVLLKHLIGLLRADRGTIRVEGRDVTQWTEAQWIPLRTQIGFVFQGAALFDSIPVFENVAYSLREHLSWSEDRIRDRVIECLGAVGLEGAASVMPAELSGGMRKRVGVARAIALEPRAILYDEPTTGLDPASSRRIGELIGDLQDRLRVTSVVVTHDLPLCFAVSDRVGLLDEGRLAMEGSVEEFRRSTLPPVRRFLADSQWEGRGAGKAREGGGPWNATTG